MLKGYWMIHVDVADLEKYKAYMAANAEPLKKYGARFLARGGKFEIVEGKGRSRHTVVEFPSYQAAVDCWKSAEYQYALSLRQPVATMDLTIVEGYDGPQPN
jgi:uncharacterized protein (DUF1330 family)